MPDALHLALFLLLGGVLGMLGGLLGLGGGIIAIPVLGLAFGLNEQHAQGTALVMVAPNVLQGLWGYARRGSVDRRVAILLAACAVPFTYLGALYATRIAGPGLRFGFGAYAAVLAVWFTYDTLRKRSDELARGGRDSHGAGPASSARSAASCLGCFRWAAPLFSVPFLLLVFAYSQKEAQGLSLALVAPGTIVGIVTYALAGDVDWGIGIPLAIGGSVCVRYGVALAHRLPERKLRLVFCAFLAAAALGLLSRGS